jgi:hypothetical protein
LGTVANSLCVKGQKSKDVVRRGFPKNNNKLVLTPLHRRVFMMKKKKSTLQGASFWTKLTGCLSSFKNLEFYPSIEKRTNPVFLTFLSFFYVVFGAYIFLFSHSIVCFLILIDLSLFF